MTCAPEKILLKNNPVISPADMSKMKNLEQEARKAGKAADFHEMECILNSKLALLSHALIHETKELSPWSFSGLAYLVSEVEDSVLIALEFCQKSENYFYYLNNPAALQEDKEIQAMLAGRK